jgi:hypothetical protein
MKNKVIANLSGNWINGMRDEKTTKCYLNRQKEKKEASTNDSMN